jgi:hypothetical protein
MASSTNDLLDKQNGHLLEKRSSPDCKTSCPTTAENGARVPK